MASQIAPALAPDPAAGISPATPRTVTIRLDPIELGRVEIRLGHAHDAPAKVELTVERPETLLMLLRDQPQLHRALDLAGVPAAGRTVQFHLASDVQLSAQPNLQPAPIPGLAADAAPSFSQSFSSLGNQPGNSGGQNPPSPWARVPTPFDPVPTETVPATSLAALASRRTGIDITA